MRDTQNKKQGYCCGFFQAIADCFSQCCQEKPSQHNDFLDEYAEGLFDNSRTGTFNNHELDVTPRLASRIQANTADEFCYAEIPWDRL